MKNFLLEVGCKLEREKGDHRIYSKPGLARPVVIPREKSLAVFVIKNNLRILGIETKEYLGLLRKLK